MPDWRKIVPAERRSILLRLTGGPLMGLEVGGLTGAASGEKGADRVARRNGYWDRLREARAGTVELRTPKPRQGAHFPGCCLEPQHPCGAGSAAPLSMDEAETALLAYKAFPAAHRTKPHSVNPLERLNGEIERRTNLVGSRAAPSTPPASTRSPVRSAHHRSSSPTHGPSSAPAT